MDNSYNGYIFTQNFIDSLSKVSKKNYIKIDSKLKIMSQSALKMLEKIQEKKDND